MKLNLIKLSSTNSWLIANLRFWGSAPTILFFLLVLAIRQDSISRQAVYGMGPVMALVGTFMLMHFSKTEKPVIGYSIVLFLALFFDISMLSQEAISKTYSVWVFASIPLSLLAGAVIAAYIYEYYQQFVSRYYQYRNANTIVHGTRLKLSYQGFVEGLIFTYSALQTAGLLFA